jgi:hypothetical protein
VINETDHAEPPVAIARNADALAYVSTAGGNNVVKVAEWPTFRSLAEFPLGEERVEALTMSGDARRLLAQLTRRERKPGDWTPTCHWSIRCWDVPTGRELLRRSDNEEVRLSADARILVAYKSEDPAKRGHVVAWDLDTGKPRWERHLPYGTSASFGHADGDSPVEHVAITVCYKKQVLDLRRVDLRFWATSSSWQLPFRDRFEVETQEFIDVETGNSVVPEPTPQPGKVIQSTCGPLAVKMDQDLLPVDETPPVVDVWDVPPRRKPRWFMAGAALFAVPPFLIARRRVRRLRREAAA